jgi:hypothetical protein
VNFDAWRDAYDKTPYSEQVANYEQAWKLYPDQQHYDEATARRFFAEMAPVGRVVEVGGWRGELAAKLLADLEVDSWVNYEICEGAASAPVCLHRAYRAFVPDDFIWTTERVPMDVLVASHVIEHMRWSELQQLFQWARHAKAFYVASPLPVDGSAPDWRGYPGTHILEVGWLVIEGYLTALGFTELQALRTHEVRCFASVAAAS